ncbi:L-tyrosine/L-tryptophan isonitrile synthase family protein [Mycolicibacterium boenickei]
MSESAVETARSIFAILDRYRKNPDRLKYHDNHIVKQLASFVERTAVVQCLFPACHGKIDHPDLLIDNRADLSEYLCVQQLAQMNDEVKAVYPPGLDVFMVHEGHFYVDTGLIRSDESMDEYLDDVRKLTSQHSFIRSMSIRELFPECSSPLEARTKFLQTYCPQDVDTAGHERMLSAYSERIRSLFRDGDHLGRYGQFDSFDEFVSVKAFEQLAIWVGFRRMLSDRLGNQSDFVRFSSVYKTPEVIDQVALNHLPVHHLEMPSFYSVCKKHDGSFGFIKRSEAISRGLETSDVGGYRYFNPDPAEAVAVILDSYRKNPFNEVFDISDVEDRIRRVTRTRQPIPLILPGFHGKTNNPNFVFGPSIDMGEKIALTHLCKLLDDIKAAYAPGAVLHVVHECHFYVGRSPLIGTQNDVDSYLSDLRRMFAERADIKSWSVYELIEHGATLEEKLNHFVATYCPTADRVADCIGQPHYLNLYKSYKRVNQLHQSNNPDFLSLSARERKQRTKELATIQMQIYFGFGALIKEFFKDLDYVRLSTLYKAPEFRDCVAVNYLPGLHHMSTPTFHCVVKREDGRFDFIRKSDAIERRYVIREKEGLKYFATA